MAPAKYETTSVKIGADEYIFTVSASKIVFDGFMSVYTDEEDQKKGNVLNQSLEKGMKLTLKELKPEQHFTQPPAHYTEASLVKTTGRTGNRTSEYLCADYYHYYQPPLCGKGAEESLCYRAW